MNIRDLSVLAYARGFTLWVYQDQSKSVTEMTAPGFFADAGDMTVKGDVIFVVGFDGVRVATLTFDGDVVKTESVA